MKPTTCATEYDFTLVLTGNQGISDEAVNALFDAGCDDATVSIRSGRVYVTFSRAAGSMKEAILSAIRDVRAAGINMDVLRVDDCNLVTQAEIARKIDRSRQLVSQYIQGTRGPGGFPPPACNISDEAPLWRWCEVAYWLCDNNMLRAEALCEAEAIEVVNNVLEWQHQKRLKPELADEILRSVGAPNDRVANQLLKR
jgi:hypothetical protein